MRIAVPIGAEVVEQDGSVDAAEAVIDGSERNVSDTVHPLHRRRVVPPQEPVAGHHAAIALPAEEGRVREVRRFTAAVLRRRSIADDHADSALLIVGELAANSAVHGRT